MLTRRVAQRHSVYVRASSMHLLDVDIARVCLSVSPLYACVRDGVTVGSLLLMPRVNDRAVTLWQLGIVSPRVGDERWLYGNWASPAQVWATRDGFMAIGRHLPACGRRGVAQ